MIVVVLRDTGFVARAYRAMDYVWWRFRSRPEWRVVSDRTDLCTLVRTTILLGPLAILCQAGAVLWALYVAAYFGFVMWLNVTTFMQVVVIIVIALVLIVAAICLIGAAFWAAEMASESEAVTVARQYYRAKKELICPLVEIRSDAHV